MAKTAVREMKRYELADVTTTFREGFDSPLLDAEGGADVLLDFAYAAKPRLCLYSIGLR
jgi:hypothetical protein